MRVLITGGTGLVGREIVWELGRRGDVAVIVSRSAEKAANVFRAFPHREAIEIVQANPCAQGPWTVALDGCDAVVNLAGEPIFGKRWSARQKARLRESRVAATQTLVRAIAEAEDPPGVLASASAIGYYGNTGEAEVNETSPGGDDFLAGICRDWEDAALVAGSSGVRVAVLRLGVVLDAYDGALAAMKVPFKLGLGGPIGRGRMWMSWVHVADVAAAFLFALDRDDARGAFNVTAPNPARNKEFSQALAKALHRPCLFPVPPIALRLLYGPSAEVITASQKVLPKRLEADGFQFKFRTCEGALEEIFSG